MKRVPVTPGNTSLREKRKLSTKLHSTQSHFLIPGKNELEALFPLGKQITKMTIIFQMRYHFILCWWMVHMAINWTNNFPLFLLIKHDFILTLLAKENSSHFIIRIINLCMLLRLANKLDIFALVLRSYLMERLSCVASFCNFKNFVWQA